VHREDLIYHVRVTFLKNTIGRPLTHQMDNVSGNNFQCVHRLVVDLCVC
jgi:hypothetical protein